MAGSMKALRWLYLLLGFGWTMGVFAATPNDPVDPRLRAIYQRLHFSRQFPPEAVQAIQASLQDAEKPVPVLAELAGSDRPEVRTLVCLLLGEYGDPDGGKTLWKLIQDNSEPVRMSAAAGLARLAHFTSFPVSTEGLTDERAEVRRFVAATLSYLKDKTAESALIETLQDENEMVRMEATKALAVCGTQNCVPSLIEKLQDRSAQVRESAAIALGWHMNQTSMEALVRALEDPDWHVRAAIIQSFGMKGNNPDITAQVTPIILRHLQNDDYALVRDRAADALAGVSDEKVIDALVHAVVTDQRDVRLHASEAIISGRSVSALPKLIEHRNHPNPEVREKIVQIIGRLGGAEHLPILMQAASDPEPQVKLAAVQALQQLKDRGAAENLIVSLTDSNSHVRAAACRALGEIGDTSTASKIVPLLRDESGYVRSAAAEALGKLGDRTAIQPLLQVLTGELFAEKSDAGVVIGAGKEFLAGFAELTEAQQKARAVEALGVLRAPEAVDPIIEHGLKASDPILRAVSAYSLGQIRDPRAVGPLQDAVRPFYSLAPTDLDYVIDPGTTRVDDEQRRLKEKEARVRASVAWALGQIGDPSARDTLLKAVNDQNSLVRDSAVEALARISEREEKLATAAPKTPTR